MKFHPTKFPHYYITDDGRVWTKWHTKGNKSWLGELKEVPQHNRGGASNYPGYKKGGLYKGINISIKDETTGRNIKRFRYSVHRLIAETLIENPNNLDTVNHIDNDKSNNSVDNLEWMERHSNWRLSNVKKDSLGRFTNTPI